MSDNRFPLAAPSVSMLYDAVDDPGARTSSELRAAYDRQLREAVETVGVEDAAAETDVDEARLSALVDGESPDLTLEEAASILALADGVRDAETVVLETRDHLLMSMTTAVVDVDTIAVEIDSDLTGQEVQQSLEGRVPLSLDELATIQAFLAGRNDR